jgi:hypothetical protein
MAHKFKRDEQMEAIMTQLADSILQLSDEEILDEVREGGVDPQKEAERTRAVLLQASTIMEMATSRLWELGHTINSKNWWRKERSYHNNCLTCGALASFTPATNELRGLALDGPCGVGTEHAARRRTASGR